MTTTTQTSARGAVGRRVLTCLQTIDVGRLTSDPVFLVPGGFIAVTGQGPDDSNQSSKTTLEAALSLLHGDPGWLQQSPQFSSFATRLLFNPPNAPKGAAVRADVGFIVGVFNAAGGEGSGQLLGGGDMVTVWIRLRRHDDPAFEVALAPGLQLARGTTHRDRIEDAKRVWSSLRGPKWGPQRYARELYGAGVSCLSYVAKRGGRSERRNTLLGSDVSELTPEEIAWQLVDLAAMKHLFDNEAAQRVEYFRLSQRLKAKADSVTSAKMAVDRYTTEVQALEERLDLLDQALAARDRYVAEVVQQTVLDIASLRTDRDVAVLAVDNAKSAVDNLTQRLAALDPTIVAREIADAAKDLATAEAARQPTAKLAERLAVDLKLVARDRRDRPCRSIGSRNQSRGQHSAGDRQPGDCGAASCGHPSRRGGTGGTDPHRRWDHVGTPPRRSRARRARTLKVRTAPKHPGRCDLHRSRRPGGGGGAQTPLRPAGHRFALRR